MLIFHEILFMVNNNKFKILQNNDTRKKKTGALPILFDQMIQFKNHFTFKNYNLDLEMGQVRNDHVR